MGGGVLADVTFRLGQILGVKLQQSEGYLTMQSFPQGWLPCQIGLHEPVTWGTFDPVLTADSLLPPSSRHAPSRL